MSKKMCLCFIVLVTLSAINVLVIATRAQTGLGLQPSSGTLEDDCKPLGRAWLEKSAGTNQWPTVHWSRGMKLGEFKMEGGAILEHIPLGKRTRPILVGIPLDKQPPVNLLPTDREIQLSESQRFESQKQLAEWFAGYYGEPLPPPKRTELSTLYRETAEQAHALLLREPTKNRQATLTALATLASGFLIKEQEILAPYREARTRRYGLKAQAPMPSRDNQVEMSKKLAEFFSGAYLVKEQRTLTTPKRSPFKGKAYERASVRLVPGQPTSREETVDVGDPELVGFETRVFIAEHPIFGQDWLGALDLVHTSVIAGYWYTLKQTQEVRTYLVEATTSGPAISKPAEMVRQAHGTLVGTKRQTAYVTRFLDWVHGNGCSGTYQSGDTLRLFWAFTSATLDEANRVLESYSAPTDCLNNYATYPLGCYGLNWVCHEAANDFAYWRWGLVPVTYWDSIFFYGLFGNLGWSPCEATYGFLSAVDDYLGPVGDFLDSKIALPPCVPGAGCPGNVCPGCSGDGHWMWTAWNSDDQWISSTCKWSEEAIPAMGTIEEEVTWIEPVS